MATFRDLGTPDKTSQQADKAQRWLRACQAKFGLDSCHKSGADAVGGKVGTDLPAEHGTKRGAQARTTAGPCLKPRSDPDPQTQPHPPRPKLVPNNSGPCDIGDGSDHDCLQVLDLFW